MKLILFTLMATPLVGGEFDALRTLENSYDTLMPAIEKSKEAFVWYTGIPDPLFNSVMRLSYDQNLENKVDALIAKAPAGTPLSFFVYGECKAKGLDALLSERGFQLAGIAILMEADVQPIQQPNAMISRADISEFSALLGENFHLEREVQDQFGELCAHPDLENYLLYLEGKPIGTASLYTKGEEGCIYNMSVLATYQKRGCGTMLMQFLMHRANQKGVKKIALLSTPEAEKLYSNFGFRKCTEIDLYIKI